MVKRVNAAYGEATFDRLKAIKEEMGDPAWEDAIEESFEAWAERNDVDVEAAVEALDE